VTEYAQLGYRFDMENKNKNALNDTRQANSQQYTDRNL
jgi:hypothetical protein